MAAGLRSSGLRRVRLDGCAPVDRGAAVAGRPQAQGPPRRLPAPVLGKGIFTPMTGRLRVPPGAGPATGQFRTVTGSWRQRPGLEEAAAQQSHREPQPGGLSFAAPAGRSPASRQGASLSDPKATRPSSREQPDEGRRGTAAPASCRDPGPVRRRPACGGPGFQGRGRASHRFFLGWLSQEQPDEGPEDHHHSRASWSPGLGKGIVGQDSGRVSLDSSAFCSGS